MKKNSLLTTFDVRQGDVRLVQFADTQAALQKFKVKPDAAPNVGGLTILAAGASTGHSHRFQKPFKLQETNNPLVSVVEVTEPLPLIHDEHSPIDVPAGVTFVIRQRQFVMREIQRVVD